MAMQKRVADEIDTTFKSDFHKSISLDEMCEPDHILEYVKAGSGKKYLVKPQMSQVDSLSQLKAIPVNVNIVLICKRGFPMSGCFFKIWM